MIWARFRKNLSWHVLLGDRTRCGRRWVEFMETTNDVPGDERTCERCATLTLHDEQVVVTINQPFKTSA